MKKWIALLLAYCLVLALGSGCAKREPEAYSLVETPPPTEIPAEAPREETFVFRDGVTWLMSRAEVVALEGEDYEEKLSRGHRLLYYWHAAAERFDEIMLLYIFDDATDQLIGAVYTKYSPEEEDLPYMKDLLASRYGEPREADPEAYHDYYVTLNTQSDYNRLNVGERPVWEWSVSGNTSVWMDGEVHNGTFSIQFISPYFLETPPRKAETE